MSSSTEKDNTPPRNRKKLNYRNKYNKAWEKQFKWIGPSNLSINNFYCKSCAVNLSGGIIAIKKHEATKKHIKLNKAVNMQQSIFNISNFSSAVYKQKKVKELEIRVASFIVDHNISFNTVSHLEGLLKEFAKDPEAAQSISIRRTKCAAIVKNVIGQHAFNSLIKTIQKTQFSILVDESTDHSSTKHLAIIVRFVENLTVHDEFLALLPVADASATSMYNLIVNFFIKHNVDYKTLLVGLGADGAHAMMGSKHSLQVLLKNDVPNLIEIKCVCHSLALCVSKACLKLPRTPEDLVRDIYTYFQYSYKRQENYKQFQSFSEVKPHKILQNCQTRWLSLLSVARRVIEQYNSLILFFQSEYMIDKIQASEIILNRLRDPINLCYLEFMEFILPYINDINIEFQSESPKLFLLYKRIKTLILTILEFYIDPAYLKEELVHKIEYKNPRLFLKLENIYLGPKIQAKFISTDLNEGQKNDFRKRCLDFYLELLSQVFLRFPLDSDFANGLKLLNFMEPKNITHINSLGPLINSNMFKYAINDVNMLDHEWRTLRSLYRSSKQMSDLNTCDFWNEIKCMKKGDDSPAFPCLINLITYIYTLPHSSATVERLFSQINANKTKTRNRLNTDTLTGILHSKRIILCDKNKNCYNYKIDDEMIRSHNIDMYNAHTKNLIDNDN